MSHTPPVPSRHFAGMFSELEASLADKRRDWFNNHHAMLLDNLLTCIREQQAALKEAIEEADACHDDEHGTPSPNLDVARAVLAKWRIE